MPRAPGQKPGHVIAPAGFNWDSYVARLVEEHGSLAAVASKVVESRGWTEDAESVERGLRRLRVRGHRDGGDMGRRLLALFGVPRDIEERVRWLGLYHARFTDLPASLCHDQLALWDRPPTSESSARVWIQLGWAHLALRDRAIDAAESRLAQAAAVARGQPAALLELALVGAYVAEKRGRVDDALRALADAEQLLESPEISTEDRVCFLARLLDQQAFHLNRATPPDHRAARALYERIPADAPPFARCRRESGLAFAAHSLGVRAEALVHATAAVEAAGDGGSLRLRVMALKMLARVQGGEEGERTRIRAEAIARRLEDGELLYRTRPRRASAPE